LLQDHEPLTEREWQVAVLVAEGRVNKEVATELGLSPATVKGYLETVYAKLGIHGRVELAK
jgi:DNA-binding NarL/FixJ family response regulator